MKWLSAEVMDGGVVMGRVRVNRGCGQEGEEGRGESNLVPRGARRSVACGGGRRSGH